VLCPHFNEKIVRGEVERLVSILARGESVPISEVFNETIYPGNGDLSLADVFKLMRLAPSARKASV
jgi:hypothetical protein